MNTEAPSLEDHVIIPAGTEYSVAIARLLYFAFPNEEYGVDFPDTGLTTPKLAYQRDSDWFAEACDLASAIAKRLVRTNTTFMRKPGSIMLHGDMWRLVDADSTLVRNQDRSFALTLAFQMGFLDVDDMLESMTPAQWAEWRRWLQVR